MSALLVTIFLTVGACTWIYSKFQRATGNDTQRSAIGTAVIGAVIFIIGLYLFSKIMS